MADFLMQLADPALVARIQRACGVSPAAPAACGRTPEAAAAAGSETTYHTSNGTSNGRLTDSTNTDLRDRSKQQNGFTQHDQNKNGTSHQKHNGSVSGDANGHAPASNKTDQQQSTTPRPLIDQDGVTPDECFHIGNRFLHILFSLGAELGNESFYIIFYPYFFWNIDGYIARRVCWFWCLFMYAGQAAKDVIKWPRPAAPPVFRLEKKYAFEYGMPSTHAMVGVGLPFLTYFLALERYEFNWAIGLAGTVFWCTIVCFSRLYLGMHSVLDVLAGIAFSSLLLPIWMAVMNPLDQYVLHHPTAPVLSMLVPLAMCLSYPKLEQWSTARGDTTLVIGVGAGVALSHWINYQYGFMALNTVPGPYPIPELTLALLGEHMRRMLVGGVLALLTRAVFKYLTYNGSCHYWGLDPKDPLTKQELGVELPVKFITYVVLSLVVVVLTPILFRYMDIGRESFYTEL